MNSTVKLLSAVAFCGLLAQPVLSDPQRNVHSRQPSTGVLPAVDGVGSLTISGGGYWHKETYEDGEQPSVDAYDEVGNILPDGLYRYEFRSSPQLSESEASAQGNSAFGLAKGRAQAGELVRGQFEISGGAIIFH